MKHWQNFYGMKVLLEIKFSFLFVVVYKKIETKTNEQIFTVYIYIQKVTFTSVTSNCVTG